MPPTNSSVTVSSTPLHFNETSFVDPQLPQKWQSSKYLVYTIRVFVIAGMLFTGQQAHRFLMRHRGPRPQRGTLNHML